MLEASLHATRDELREAVERQGVFAWHARCMARGRPTHMRLARYHHFTKGDLMKRFIALALAATFALPSFALLTGCNTVEGAGKDIQAGGAKIKEEAKENKKY